jgi:glycosyltransferase involved in cell wall biosynthesis
VLEPATLANDSAGVQRVAAPSVRTMRVHFISDLATPHVNALLAALSRKPGIELELAYCAESFPGLPTWQANPTHSIKRATLFGRRSPSARLLGRSLARPSEKLIIVGWSNPTTRLLLPLLDAAGRRFIFFTDEPADIAGRSALRDILRTAYFRVLRRRATVLATGVNAVRYFAQRGIPEHRILDAPIPTLVPAELPRLRALRAETRRRYSVPQDALMVIAGSRLIWTKGFDVLTRAVGALHAAERVRLKVLLVGSGPEEPHLRALITEHGLQDSIRLHPWMELADFEAAFAAADVAIHPSRFDGYGATSLMATGIGLPIIGTRTAGAAAELVVPAVNGYLYDAEDVASLRDHLRTFLEHPELAAQMGRESTRLANRWSPDHVADVFVKALRMLD